MTTTKEDKLLIDSLQKDYGISDNIVTIHPGASCESKRWAPERFAEVADHLKCKYGYVDQNIEDMTNIFLHNITEENNEFNFAFSKEIASDDKIIKIVCAKEYEQRNQDIDAFKLNFLSDKELHIISIFPND